MDKSKGKTVERMQQAVEELEYLVTFNRSISQAMQRTMHDLLEGVFISIANLTLARRDSYLEFIHGGVKQNTLTALRTSHVHLHSLFPDNLLVKAEDEISHEIFWQLTQESRTFSSVRFLKWQINTVTGPEAHYTGLEAD